MHGLKEERMPDKMKSTLGPCIERNTYTMNYLTSVRKSFCLVYFL